MRAQLIREYRDEHRAWIAAGSTAEIATAKLAADLAMAKLAAELIERSNSAKLAVVLSSA